MPVPHKNSGSNADAAAYLAESPPRAQSENKSAFLVLRFGNLNFWPLMGGIDPFVVTNPLTVMEPLRL